MTFANDHLRDICISHSPLQHVSAKSQRLAEWHIYFRMSKDFVSLPSTWTNNALQQIEQTQYTLNISRRKVQSQTYEITNFVRISQSILYQTDVTPKSFNTCWLMLWCLFYTYNYTLNPTFNYVFAINSQSRYANNFMQFSYSKNG